jgi:hypothetical protein
VISGSVNHYPAGEPAVGQLNRKEGSMSTSLIIKKFLQPTVKDSKDRLARQARAQIKRRVEEADGKIERFDLLQGTIFVDVDSEASANAIVELFKKFDDVKVETVEPLQAIYAKGRLKLAETIAA